MLEGGVWHLTDYSKEHKMIPFKKRRSTSSSEHHGHTFVEMIKIVEKHKSVPDMDLQELDNFIYPSYRGIASNILDQKADLMKKHSKNNNSYHKT